MSVETVLHNLVSLSLVLSLGASFVLILLGKWKVLSWAERNKPLWTGPLCLFCWGFWVAVLLFSLFSWRFGFTHYLAATPFLAAPLVRFIIGSIK